MIKIDAPSKEKIFFVVLLVTLMLTVILTVLRVGILLQSNSTAEKQYAELINSLPAQSKRGGLK